MNKQVDITKMNQDQLKLAIFDCREVIQQNNQVIEMLYNQLNMRRQKDLKVSIEESTS